MPPPSLILILILNPASETETKLMLNSNNLIGNINELLSNKTQEYKMSLLKVNFLWTVVSQHTEHSHVIKWNSCNILSCCLC